LAPETLITGPQLVFVSGLTARNSEGVVIGKDEIRAQTIQVFENLKLAMASAGGTLRDIMRVDVFIEDMSHFKVIHEVRGRYFDQDPPASTMVAVSAFTHPDTLIEINAIAALP
jgi:enamine deaminase RidA (YjgF/YER057c/UK114 family)